MIGKKPVIFKSPDISKLKVVMIDHRTKIYVDPDADVDEVISRYKMRNTARRVK